MKLKIGLLFFFIIFFVIPTPTYAQQDTYNSTCGPISVSAELIVNESNPEQFDVMACIRGFTSEEQLRSSNLQVQFVCSSKSSGGGGTLGSCQVLQGPTDRILQTASFNPSTGLVGFENDSYFTCFRGLGLNRDIGEMDVEFINNVQNCTVTGVNTVPADYNFGEHLSSVGDAYRTGGTMDNTGQFTNDLYCADGSINTAIGCISTDASGGFITQILQIAVGIGGAIALILILFGFFIITTSAGMPDKVKSGQEIITGAVTGLLFIIFSVILLQIIGVQILAIPGL